MKIRNVFACLSCGLWVFLLAWSGMGSAYYSKEKRSIWSKEVIRNSVTYSEFVEKKTGLHWGGQMFCIAAMAGACQFLAMRKGKKKRNAEQ